MNSAYVRDPEPIAISRIKVRIRLWRRVYNKLKSIAVFFVTLRYRLARRLYNRYKELTVFFITLRYRLIKRLRFRYIRLLVYFGFRLWLKEIHNFEKLPQNGPAIIISNHTSYYDWSVLSAIYRRKYIVFLGAKELTQRHFVKWLMKLNILVYIDRDHPGFSYFKEVLLRLKNGHIVVIYPEGKRSRTGKMIEPKTGFVKLAEAAGVPVVPIGMKGTFEILPPNKSIPRLRKCELFVGDPFRISKDNPMFSDVYSKEVSGKHLSDDGMRIIAMRIMNSIARMTGQEWDDSVKAH